MGGQIFPLQVVRSHRFVFAIRVLGCVATKPFRATTVVLQKEKEGVVKLFLAFYFRDNASDALIHVVNHGGVDFHISTFPLFVLSPFPVVGTRRHFNILCNQSDFLEAFQALFPNRVESFIVLSLVLCNVLGECMHRPMGCCVGGIQKERFVRSLFGNAP